MELVINGQLDCILNLSTSVNEGEREEQRCKIEAEHLNQILKFQSAIKSYETARIRNESISHDGVRTRFFFRKIFSECEILMPDKKECAIEETNCYVEKKGLFSICWARSEKSGCE